MGEPLISVIVPVYNVEQYLEECLDSILAQTYEYFELLLIDDGSTDNSADICHRYTEKDSRVRLISKPNGGQAEARNVGIDESSGDYLAFVDSDDIVHPDYLKRMFENLQKEQADISACNFKRFYDEDTNLFANTEDVELKVMSEVEALDSYLYKREITSSPCYYIFSREAIGEIRFPVGCIYEDLGTIYKFIARAKKVVYTPDILYAYRKRRNSTTQLSFSLRNMARVDFSEEIITFVNERYPELEKAAVSRLFTSYFLALCEMPYKKEYADEYTRVTYGIKRTRRIVLFDSKAKLSTRIVACASFGSMRVLKKAGNLLLRN